MTADENTLRLATGGCMRAHAAAPCCTTLAWAVHRCCALCLLGWRVPSLQRGGGGEKLSQPEALCSPIAPSLCPAAHVGSGCVPALPHILKFVSQLLLPCSPCGCVPGLSARRLGRGRRLGRARRAGAPERGAGGAHAGKEGRGARAGGACLRRRVGKG